MAAIEEVNRPNAAFVEFASWRIAAELSRRFPSRLRVVEMHPGGGMYDCLVLVDGENEERVVINREGSLRVRRNGDDVRPWNSAWPQALLMAHDPREFLDTICAAMGWSAPLVLPSTTRRTLVYRLMAEFLSHTCLARGRWQWRSGYRDTSGVGGSGRAGWFDDFPRAGERVRSIEGDDILGEPARRFWFLTRSEEGSSSVPAICLETGGRAYLRTGETCDLFASYQQHRRIWPLIMKVMPDLLP